jgi:tetratricopeptide (TPR) repeat protein
MGAIFNVRSAPENWSRARTSAAAWFGAAPKFSENPGENLFRRLTLIEALTLNATDPAVHDELEAQRAELLALVLQVKTAKPAALQDWQAQSLVSDLRDLDQQLGTWLADSPEERLAVFRDQLAAFQPPDRTSIAARYGGEEKLAALIKEAGEYHRLVAAIQAVMADKALKEEDKRQALAKASAALGFFQGYHWEDKQLYAVLRDPDLAAEFSGEDISSSFPTLDIPDLVEWAGAAGAEPLLKEAFSLPVRIELRDDNRTRKLALTLIKTGKITLKTVPWTLIEWPENNVGADDARELVALYDVFHAQLGDLTKQAKSDWNGKAGLARLAVALGTQGRTEEATILIKAAGQTDPGFPYHGSVNKAFAATVWDFLLKVSDAENTTESWTTLSNLASQAGRGKELIAWADQQVKAAPADSVLAKTWRMRKGWALVAAGQADEALAMLMPAFEEGPGAEDDPLVQEWTESAVRLLKLTAVLDRSELSAKLHERLAVDFKDAHSPLWKTNDLFTEFARQDMAAARFAPIEALVRNRLTAKPQPKQPGDDAYDGSRDFDAKTYSMWLADLLAREGRYEEVVQLLANSPDWSAPDLSQMLDAGGGDGWRPLALIVAETLHVTGRDPQAIAILEAYLVSHAASDPAYELYTSIRGIEAVAFLEKLRAMDHYEERPLIWKAQLLVSAGRVDEAEMVIKQAIAIDPSDGGEPHGDRMRAYAVARQIALKKGDTAHAEFLGSVVTAIRMAEAADDVADAGLIGRAILEYQEALNSFSDAYCIQSRLAIRLAGENRMDEAIEHYKRAYELMPDSFGRVESHCFGCERAFAGEQPQAIAERVFMALIAKPPVKLQAFYLMGYLRQEQERWEEAADYFSKAVSADPEYLNAWKKLAGVLPHTTRPRAERDKVAFKQFALDPYQHHSSSGLDVVRDIPALWNAAAAVDQSANKMPDTLYPLGDKAGGSEHRQVNGYVRSGDLDSSPDGLLARHDVLQMVVRQLSSCYSWKQQNQ